MELVKAPYGRRKGFARRDALEQLCDVGARLDHVIRRYERLVREISGATMSAPDLGGRVDMINSQLVFVAQRLQEMLILEHEAARAEALALEGSEEAARTAFPRSVVQASA